MTFYGKRRWYRRLARSVRRYTLYWTMIGIGLFLLFGAGAAAAAITLSGKGTLVAPAYDGKQLQVTDEHLSQPLAPAAAADLVFTVRNPHGFAVRVYQVGLASPMSRAKPAGCTARVSGPVLRGYTFPAGTQVTVPPGARTEISVPAAFRLAPAATRGCGFTVDILVSAVQGGSVPTPPVDEPGGTPPVPPPSSALPSTPPSTELPSMGAPAVGDLPDPADGGGPA